MYIHIMHIYIHLRLIDISSVPRVGTQAVPAVAAAAATARRSQRG